MPQPNRFEDASGPITEPEPQLNLLAGANASVEHQPYVDKLVAEMRERRIQNQNLCKQQSMCKQSQMASLTKASIPAKHEQSGQMFGENESPTNYHPNAFKFWRRDQRKDHRGKYTDDFGNCFLCQKCVQGSLFTQGHALFCRDSNCFAKTELQFREDKRLAKYSRPIWKKAATAVEPTPEPEPEAQGSHISNKRKQKRSSVNSEPGAQGNPTNKKRKQKQQSVNSRNSDDSPQKKQPRIQLHRELPSWGEHSPEIAFALGNKSEQNNQYLQAIQVQNAKGQILGKASVALLKEARAKRLQHWVKAARPHYAFAEEKEAIVKAAIAVAESGVMPRQKPERKSVNEVLVSKQTMEKQLLDLKWFYEKWKAETCMEAPRDGWKNGLFVEDNEELERFQTACGCVESRSTM